MQITCKLVAIWSLAIWQNLCFGRLYHTRIEVLQITQLLALVHFVSVCLCRKKERRLRENLKHKIRAQAPSQDKNPDWTLRRPVASAAFDVLFSLMIPEPERFKPQWNIEGTVYILGQ